jgi:trans-aconitate methyltransferase
MEFDLFNAETEHPVLQIMSNNCIEEIMKQLKEKESAFTEPQQYVNHSGTQREQGEILLYLVGRALKSKKTVRRILDIGVGTGNLVSALREQYGDAELAGIDSSNEMLSYVSNRYKDDHRFSFRNIGIDDSTVLELGNFDVIVSNATMHWIKDQDKAYRNMHNLLNEDGIIAIHQGAEGCYKELYDLTEKALAQKGFQVPQGKFLSYHTIESIKFIEPLGFEIIDSRIMSEIPSATLIEDFSHAGMLPYLRGLNKEEKITVREDFITMAKKLPSITVRRLYFVARKVNH